jgi:KRAB domain-containing zinc finger protein
MVILNIPSYRSLHFDNKMAGSSRRKSRLPRKILRVHHSDGRCELHPQENGYKQDELDYQNGHSPLNSYPSPPRASPPHGLHEMYENHYTNGHNGYAGEYLKEATKSFLKSQENLDYVVVQPSYDLPPPALLSDTTNMVNPPKREDRPIKQYTGEKKSRDIPNVSRKHHHPEPTPEYPYQCETCDMLFKSIELLTDHQKTLHDNNRQFACRYCSKRFNDKYNMRKHVLIHVGEKRHKCQFCDKAFLRKDHLRSHLQTHYNRKYGCKVCGKSFRTVELYQRHAKTHKDSDMSQLTNNMENLHPMMEEKLTPVKREEATVTDENGVKVMVLDDPYDDGWNQGSPNRSLSDYDLSVNGSPLHGEYGSPQPQQPNGHGDSTAIAGYKCKFCNDNFEDKMAMVAHEQKCRSDTQKWQCIKCNIVFDEPSTLKQHYEKVHSTEKPTQSPSRWRCKTCDINYPNSKELSRHYAHAHKDANIFPCSECPKTFTVWHNLKKHMLIHLGDKKHKCNVCDKGFVRKDHLNSHMKVHLGDGSKFTCPICSKVFRLKQMYFKHMNLHGLEQAYHAEA